MVSKEERDKAKTSFVEEYIPLRDLDVNGIMLPCENGITLVDVNKQKELEKTRKSMKNNKDKENASSPWKATKSSVKGGYDANRKTGKN